MAAWKYRSIRSDHRPRFLYRTTSRYRDHKDTGYALNKDVVGINTLDAIAIQSNHTGELEVVMDAQRNEVFSRRYLLEEGKPPTPLTDVFIIDDQIWAEQLPAGIKVTGPVLKKPKETLPIHVDVEIEANWAPRAESVALLAATAEPISSPLQLMPNYFRKSAAEEKYAQNKSETENRSG